MATLSAPVIQIGRRDIVLSFPEVEGRKDNKVYSFKEDGVAPIVLIAVARAFFTLGFRYAPQSRYCVFIYLKHFTEWLSIHGTPLGEEALVDYLHWLEVTPGRSGKMRSRLRVHNLYQAALRVIEVSQRIDKKTPFSRVRLDRIPFVRPRLRHSSTETVSKRSIDLLEAACKRSILCVESKAKFGVFRSTYSDVAPFMVLLLIKTWANRDPICNLQIDCLSPHALFAGDDILIWDKLRSPREQWQRHSRSARFGPPDIVRRALMVTAHLRLQAPEAFKDRLFIGHVSNLPGDPIRPVSVHQFSKELTRLCEINGITPMNAREIRASLGRHDFLRHRDILRTRRKFGHSAVRDSKYYVVDSVIQDINHGLIMRAQRSFVGTWLKRKRKGKTADAFDQKKAVNAVSLSGFTCRDPYAGVAPGQAKGKICSAWLGCYTCPNAIIENEPGQLAHILLAYQHMLEARKTMNSERWLLLYSEKCRIIERDILPRMSATVIKKAESLAGCLPKLPDLLFSGVL